MANVLFTRDSLTNIENPSLHPVTDGQLLFDTSGSGKMYMDVGTQRLEMGGAMTIDAKLNSTSTNPIQNKAVGGVMLSTLDEINAATSKGFITDALATRALAQKIGTTDISSIGDGTCTGAISSLNAKSAFHSIQIEEGVNVSTTEKFYTGVTIVIPAKSYFSITVVGLYVHAPCHWIGISTSSASDINTCYRDSENSYYNTTLSFSTYADGETTLYIYGQWEWIGANEVMITGYYVTQ